MVYLGSGRRRQLSKSKKPRNRRRSDGGFPTLFRASARRPHLGRIIRCPPPRGFNHETRIACVWSRASSRRGATHARAFGFVGFFSGRQRRSSRNYPRFSSCLRGPHGHDRETTVVAKRVQLYYYTYVSWTVVVVVDFVCPRARSIPDGPAPVSLSATRAAGIMGGRNEAFVQGFAGITFH